MCVLEFVCLFYHSLINIYILCNAAFNSMICCKIDVYLINIDFIVYNDYNAVKCSIRIEKWQHINLLWRIVPQHINNYNNNDRVL